MKTVLPRLDQAFREHWLMLLASLACLLLAFAFTVIGGYVANDDHRTFDIAAREWVRARDSAAMQAAFGWLTHLGDRIILIPLAILFGWPLFRGHPFWLVLFIFCAISSKELNDTLKDSFDVVRPPGAGERRSLSFPSGHVTAAATIAAFVAYVAVRRRIRPFAYIAAGTVVVLLVAASRVVLDVHWTSDVIGGALIGALYGIGSAALFEWLTLAITGLRQYRSMATRRASPT